MGYQNVLPGNMLHKDQLHVSTSSIIKYGTFTIFHITAKFIHEHLNLVSTGLLHVMCNEMYYIQDKTKNVKCASHKIMSSNYLKIDTTRHQKELRLAIFFIFSCGLQVVCLTCMGVCSCLKPIHT